MKIMNISCAVDVDNPKQTQALFQFISALSSNAVNVAPPAAVLNNDPEAAPVTITPAKPPRVKKEAAPKTEAPEPTEPETQDEPERQDEPTQTAITVDLLRAKVGNALRADAGQRDQIKAKLAEYEAAGVGELDAKHYEAFNEFLNSLQS